MPLAPGSARAIVLAPLGRDAAVAQSLLRQAGIPSTVCTSLGMFETSLSDKACFAIVTEEAVASADLHAIAAWVSSQASWSDLPFIVLTQRGGDQEPNPAASRLSEILGNVTFLERPFHPTTFVSVARTALKGRERQYDARTRLEELHESAALLRTALLAGHLGAWELDLDHWTLTCSDTCKAVFGRDADASFSYLDLLGSVYPEDRAGMQVALQRSVDKAHDFATELPHRLARWRHPLGRSACARAARPRRAGASPGGGRLGHHRPEGRRAVLAAAQRDARATGAAAHSELEEAHQAVLQQIANREKAEERLRQSRKLEMIGQLTGGVAHDFNNLLTAILCNLELLGKHATENSREARLIEGRVAGCAAWRDADQTPARLRPQPGSHGRAGRHGGSPPWDARVARAVGGSLVEMRLEVAEALPPAVADQNQIEMALLNLVLNAKDAMPDGGVLSIKLHTERVDAAGRDGLENLAPGTYLRLAVTDSGHGMSVETLARTIDPFFTTKPRGKGDRPRAVHHPRAGGAAAWRLASRERAGARHLRGALAARRRAGGQVRGAAADGAGAGRARGGAACPDDASAARDHPDRGR